MKNELNEKTIKELRDKVRDFSFGFLKEHLGGTVRPEILLAYSGNICESIMIVSGMFCKHIVHYNMDVLHKKLTKEDKLSVFDTFYNSIDTSITPIEKLKIVSLVEDKRFVETLVDSLYKLLLKEKVQTKYCVYACMESSLSIYYSTSLGNDKDMMNIYVDEAKDTILANLKQVKHYLTLKAKFEEEVKL